ncbi:MAG: hypothetical protein ACLVES_04245 [Faecalibacterium prausnitzii]
MSAQPGICKAGEVYDGCRGFTYTFTHDSYMLPRAVSGNTRRASARTATAPTTTAV